MGTENESGKRDKNLVPQQYATTTGVKKQISPMETNILYKYHTNSHHLIKTEIERKEKCFLFMMRTQDYLSLQLSYISYTVCSSHHVVHYTTREEF